MKTWRVPGRLVVVRRRRVLVGQRQLARPQLAHQLVGLRVVQRRVDGAVERLHAERLERRQRLRVREVRLWGPTIAYRLLFTDPI